MLLETTARRASARFMPVLCINSRDANNAENNRDTTLARAVIAISNADSDLQDTFSCQRSPDRDASPKLRSDVKR